MTIFLLTASSMKLTHLPSGDKFWGICDHLDTQVRSLLSAICGQDSGFHACMSPIMLVSQQVILTAPRPPDDLV